MTSAVERWRAIVNAEIAAINAPFSASVFLAHIQVESGGDQLAKNPSGATGLTQVKPVALDFYNANHGTNYVIDDLFNPDLSIKVGVFILKHNWNKIANWFAPYLLQQTDLVKLGAVAYDMGWGALEKKLSGMDTEGQFGFADLIVAYPDWGAPKNTPYHYAEKIAALSGAGGIVVAGAIPYLAIVACLLVIAGLIVIAIGVF